MATLGRLWLSWYNGDLRTTRGKWFTNNSITPVKVINFLSCVLVCFNQAAKSLAET